MHDDKSWEQFLADNKPAIPAAPTDELQQLQARLGQQPSRVPQVRASRVPRMRRPARNGVLAVFLSLGLGLLVLLTRQPTPVVDAGPAGPEVESVLSESYGTLEDVVDDATELTWFDANASVD